jgi:hypothetical protein
MHEIRCGDSDDLTAGTIPLLGRVLGLHRGRLGRYAKVTEMIASQEFSELLRLRNPRGLPLTWSHIELLAMIRGVALRHKYAEEVISKHVTIRELAARVRKRSG